jgi:hypothetical protein
MSKNIKKPCKNGGKVQKHIDKSFDSVVNESSANAIKRVKSGLPENAPGRGGNKT